MITITKTFWIAFLAEISYWLLAAMVFQGGQPLLHFTAAAIMGVYATRKLIEALQYNVTKSRLMVLGIICMPIFMYVALQIIFGWISIINWTLAPGIVPTTATAYNIVRVFDMAVMALIAAIAIKQISRAAALRRTKELS